MRRPIHAIPHIATVVILVAGLFSATGQPAASQTRKDVEDARARYRGVQAQLNELAEAYANQEGRLQSTRAKISATNRAIEEAEGEASELRQELKERVRFAYRLGGLGFFDFLLSAESFRDFSLRVVLLERQATQDEDLLLRLEKLQGELNAKERVLEQQKEEQAAEAARLRDQAQRLNITFNEAKEVLSKLENQLRAKELQSLYRSRRSSGGGSARGRVINFEACPAKGPRAFSNDWGAPRGGGRRRHKGNDIFAPHGSPAAAVVSGRISRLRSGGLGGLSVYLWGDDGNEYYYAHMSGFNVSQGQRVSAGQTIAYVGDTGNAKGTSPHIHFEVHPGGGAAINPYPSLIRVC